MQLITDHAHSLVAQAGKNLPEMLETWVRSLGQEDPLKEEMATHSSILAWKILWTEEPGLLQSMGSQNWIRVTEHGREGNGTPLQYSCLENPMDGGAW